MNTLTFAAGTAFGFFLCLMLARPRRRLVERYSDWRADMCMRKIFADAHDHAGDTGVVSAKLPGEPR